MGDLPEFNAPTGSLEYIDRMLTGMTAKVRNLSSQAQRMGIGAGGGAGGSGGSAGGTPGAKMYGYSQSDASHYNKMVQGLGLDSIIQKTVQKMHKARALAWKARMASSPQGAMYLINRFGTQAGAGAMLAGAAGLGMVFTAVNEVSRIQDRLYKSQAAANRARSKTQSNLLNYVMSNYSGGQQAIQRAEVLQRAAADFRKTAQIDYWMRPSGPTAFLGQAFGMTGDADRRAEEKVQDYVDLTQMLEKAPWMRKAGDKDLAATAKRLVWEERNKRTTQTEQLRKYTGTLSGLLSYGMWKMVDNKFMTNYMEGELQDMAMKSAMENVREFQKQHERQRQLLMMDPEWRARNFERTNHITRMERWQYREDLDWTRS